MVSFLLLLLAIAAFVSAESDQLLKITSRLDGNAITNTEHLEDPGPYNVYATKAEPYTALKTQHWKYDELSELNTRQFSPQGGQFLNTFSTYKPCPGCFAANEVWRMLSVEGNYVMLKSKWTELCLTNTRNYLMKQTCDSGNVGQHWKLEKYA